MFSSSKAKPYVREEGWFVCGMCGKNLGGVGEICSECLNLTCDNCGETRAYHPYGGDCPPCKSCWHRLDLHDRTTGNCAESGCGCSAARSTEAAKHQKNVGGRQRQLDTARQLDDFKSELFDFLSDIGPGYWQNILGALGDFQTRDILQLRNMYLTIFEQTIVGMTGGDIDIKKLEAHIPTTAEDLPSFFDLPEIGQLLVNHIHETMGVEPAAEMSQEILEQPDHPVNQWEMAIEEFREEFEFHTGNMNLPPMPIPSQSQSDSSQSRNSKNEKSDPPTMPGVSSKQQNRKKDKKTSGPPPMPGFKSPKKSSK